MSIRPHSNPRSYAVPHATMRQLPGIVLLTILFAASLPATTIQYQVTTNGLTGTYEYFVSGFTALQPCPNDPLTQCSNEIDIQFDPAIFSQISNGVAPAGFDLLLFQPNDPPQAAGDYSALAVSSSPDLAGRFSVDFTLINPVVPDGQQFFIESFDNSGLFQGFAEPPGFTTQLASNVPEPADIWLSGVGVLLFGVSRLFASRSKRG